MPLRPDSFDFLDTWQGWIRHLTSREYSKVSIRGLPKDWRRPPGRPRHTWLRTLEADLQPLNLGLNSAWKYTQDREHWKQLVETATLQAQGLLVMTIMAGDKESVLKHTLSALIPQGFVFLGHNFFRYTPRLYPPLGCTQWGW